MLGTGNFQGHQMRSVKFGFIILAAGIMIFFAAGVAGAKEAATHEGHYSQNYILNMDPKSGGVIGKAAADEVHAFFDEAERAIESKDLNALMGLYSENYVNGPHKKADITATWKRLFDDFDNLAMTHNMRFVTTDPNSKIMIMQCSGILVGVPKGDAGLIALDSWMNSDHILVKEGAKFKLIGSTGAEKKRLWFDKALHPLF